MGLPPFMVSTRRVKRSLDLIFHWRCQLTICILVISSLILTVAIRQNEPFIMEECFLNFTRFKLVLREQCFLQDFFNMENA